MKLELCNITHHYGDIKALDQVSFTFTPGIYALLGPNGAGKSTMMKLITMNLVPSSGEILLDGINITNLGKDYRTLIGYMPQHQGLYDEFRADRFLAYMGALKGIRKKDIDEEITRVLALVNLSNCRTRKIGSFSGGMKQRLLIAQAIMNDPNIIILDEPTAGHDPKERINIRNIDSQIAKDKIVIFATHVVSDIEHIAKEIIMLKKGNIIVSDTVHNLCKSLDGKVFELLLDESTQLNSNWIISQLMVRGNGTFARIMGTKPNDAVEVPASLEDVYLSLFRDEDR